MPSPIAHSAAGYAIFKLWPKTKIPHISTPFGKISYLLVATVLFSLLPDLDAIPGLYFNNLDGFHNNISHSLFFGLVTAFGLAGLIWLWQRTGFVFWFLLILLCYALHVVMDYFTVGRGVMILWPFSAERYEPPIMLFYGLRRSEGLIAIHHLWTLITELSFAVVVNGVANVLSKRRFWEVPLSTSREELGQVIE